MTTVYVALLDTKYEFVAVADTEAEAVQLVSREAHAHLTKIGAIYPETDTPKKVAEYFGVRITRIDVGAATYVGNTDA